MPTVAEAFAMAVQQHQAGKLAEAEQLYRQILQADPNHADAWHLLGLLASQVGNHNVAIGCIAKAAALNPDFAEAHYNLGLAYHRLRRVEEAIACYSRAVELKPWLAEAQSNLGSALLELKRLDEAVARYRKAVAIKPDSAQEHLNLGNALKEQGDADEAIACFHQALDLKPDYVEALSSLGIALHQRGQLEEALASYQRALTLQPDCAAAYNGIGNILLNQRRFEEAIASYRQALEYSPDSPELHTNLGTALREHRRLDEAVACYRRAIELAPDFFLAHNNLGNAFKDQALLEEALACFRRAAEIKPEFAAAQSNILYALYFTPGYDVAAIQAEHRRWNDECAAPLAKFAQPHANDRSVNRRLRVGYVSPDFCAHAESFFTLPLLSAHDHEQCEVICYSDIASPDEITARLRSHADVWRSIVGLNDEQVAEMIRGDRIDILVDLTMHMVGNRLLAFARKPAPVQVCWLAYQGTTGLSAMDYRFTDPHVDPPGLDDRFYSEQSMRLPDSFWCYDPLTISPAVNPLPAMASGQITFGSLNNFCKINSDVLELWTRVVRAVDRSKLLILTAEGSHRERALRILEREGIAADRVVFFAPRPRVDYLALCHQIDIGLDSFPYNGQTTTLDCFWMGVPVVTLEGKTAVGRAGASLLRNIGLAELIAKTPDEYVRFAGKLAGDLKRLSELRAGLRRRLGQSLLMDAPRFARSVEAAYRSMWQRWCSGASGGIAGRESSS
jgi:protein O-GlcNAc transferase